MSEELDKFGEPQAEPVAIEPFTIDYGDAGSIPAPEPADPDPSPAPAPMLPGIAPPLPEPMRPLTSMLAGGGGQFPRSYADAQVAPMREVTSRIAALAGQMPDPTERILKSVFLASLDDPDSGSTQWSWHELTNEGGTLVTFGDGRACTDATDGSAALVIGDAILQSGDTVLLLEIEDDDGFRYVIVPLSGGSAVAFQVTSDFDAGTYFGRYKIKTITPGTATDTSPGTLAADEDGILFNGAEWGLATQNNLLISPNTTAFAVYGSGTVVGTVTLSAVKYKLIVAWLGYAGCTAGA